MRISDWSSDVCSSDLQQQRVENGAVDASGHRHACASDGEDDEVERLVDRTLFRRGTATQLQPDQRQGPRESGKAAENAAADADRGDRWAATPGAEGAIGRRSSRESGRPCGYNSVVAPSLKKQQKMKPTQR